MTGDLNKDIETIIETAFAEYGRTVAKSVRSTARVLEVEMLAGLSATALHEHLARLERLADLLDSPAAPAAAPERKVTLRVTQVTPEQIADAMLRRNHDPGNIGWLS